MGTLHDAHEYPHQETSCNQVDSCEIEMKTEGSQLPQTATRLNNTETSSPTNIGFIGTHGWSSQLLLEVLAKPEYTVHVHGNSSGQLQKLTELGAIPNDSSRKVAQVSQILVYATRNIEELEDQLFCPKNGIVSGMNSADCRTPVPCAQ